MSMETGKDGGGTRQTGAAFDVALDAWVPPVKVEDIRRRGEMTLSGSAPAELLEAIRDELGLEALRQFTWRGALSFESGEVAFRGQIDADLDQACVVSLEPVPETISEPMARHWLPPKRYADRIAALSLRPDEDDAPADAYEVERGALGIDLSADGADEFEQLGELVRLGPALVEALALALAPYPRASTVPFEGAAAAPEGAAPLDDEALKPFAGLSALKARLGKSEKKD